MPAEVTAISRQHSGVLPLPNLNQSSILSSSPVLSGIFHRASSVTILTRHHFDNIEIR